MHCDMLVQEAITVSMKLALASNEGVFMETAPLQRTDIEKKLKQPLGKRRSDSCPELEKR